MTFAQKDERVAVIGAGLGGCAIAALLAREGYKVDVFEKNSKVGGRCQSFYLGSDTRGKYRFDLGASMILMTEVFEELGDKVGVKLDPTALGLHKCHPSSVVHLLPGSKPLGEKKGKLKDVEVTMKFLKYAESEGIVKSKVDIFVEEGKVFYSAAKSTMLSNNFTSLFGLLESRHILSFAAMLRKSKGASAKSLYSYCKSRMNNEEVAQALSLQSMYMGLSPFDAYGFYSFLTVDELVNGIYYPVESQKGMSFLPEKLAAIAINEGAKFHLGTEVHKIVDVFSEDSTHPAIEYLSDQDVTKKLEMFDFIVCNADLCYAYDKLLADAEALQVVDNMKYGCSTISFHWGLSIDLKCLNGVHHVFLGKNFKQSFDKIFVDRKVPENISFYMHIPSNIDISAAPEGCSAVTILIPVGFEETRLELLIELRQKVFQRFEMEGIAISEADIVEERIFTPEIWGKDFNLHRNCALGLNHNVTQLGPFRPSNTDPKRPWLFFVGANSQPGCGVPTVLYSALNTFDCILKRTCSRDMNSNLFGWQTLQNIISKLRKR